MKHLKQFETEVAYTQFKDTEDYVLPNVSYVKENKGVKYERKKSYMLRAKYNATPDNLVAFTNASNVNAMSVNGTPIEIEPIKIETTAFDVLGENISVNMETGEGTFPESYLIKSHVSSWSFKAKDPNYVINENTYICMLGMLEGMTFANLMTFEEAMADIFTTNDGVTIEVSDAFLNNMNEMIQYAYQIGFTLANVDMNNNAITFIDTEHQANVKTGGLSTYSFDGEGTYDVIIELADPTIKMRFGETPLVSIKISDDIISIGEYAFSDCSSLTSVTIGNSVTNIGDYAFSGCNSLISITIPNSVTEIGREAFYDCSSLTSITIPDSVTSIGDSAFDGCSSLPVIDNIRYADTYLVEVVDNSLTSYSIKEGTRFIGDSAFYGCFSLKDITIPNSVTSIGAAAFNGCSHLNSITIPNSVTKIEGSTFWYCHNLNSITIPNSVTSIGNYAFFHCGKLLSIICYAPTAPSIQDNTFEFLSNSGTLYIPTGSDYSSWMGTGDYYLGKYNWTIQYI